MANLPGVEPGNNVRVPGKALILDSQPYQRDRGRSSAHDALRH